MSNTLEQFLATNLTSSELERLAHPPLELFLPIHELLKPPMAKREKKRPLNIFLLYRRKDGNPKKACRGWKNLVSNYKYQPTKKIKRRNQPKVKRRNQLY